MKKTVLTIALLLTTGFCYEVIEDKANLIIETPTLIQRKERKIRLDNGLEALLISDPHTHESGAALAVGVGSWDDPEDRPGMAHFVEHMLFLGTEKYPEEAGYTRYLDEHGGSRNAFTMSDRTVYMFSIDNAGFAQALDRFGHFFIAPLFNPSGVDRECKAIHQEYCKNLPLDPWRALYVKKSLANNAHPFHRFCMGNKETLNCISQEELKQWYHTHYSASLMHLVVYSPLDLDTLETEVVSLFSEVKNTSHIPAKCTKTILSADHTAKMIAICPIQDLQILELSWELPRTFINEHKAHADRLVSHVLGHEGSDSLLAELKRENLAESLRSGCFHAGRDQSLFTLSIHLTSKGVHDYERVIKRCFQTINSLKIKGIPRYIYDEVVELEELSYRFQSREGVFDFVTNVARYLVDEPLETFPRQTILPSSYAPEQVEELLENLTPYTCQYTLVAHPELTKLKPTAKERWMKVDYAHVNIEKSKLDRWAQAHPHQRIALPRPNPFVPKILSTKETPVESIELPVPSILVDNAFGKLYTCQDKRFLVPEISWTFTIKTPHILASSPKSLVLADLYCRAVNENLNAIAYEAMVAGLHYTIKPTDGGMQLTLSGYGDKAQVFLESIVSTMQSAGATAEQFAFYTEMLKREYANQAGASSLQQGGEMLWNILYKDYSTLDEKQTALSTLELDQFNTFCKTIFESFYLEGMLYGNSPTEQVWDTFIANLGSNPFAPIHHSRKELATFPNQNHPSYLILNSSQPANALILTTDCGAFSFEKRAAQEILSKGLEEPFFSELRTRQQTAYIVTNWSQEIERHLYSFFAIQSSSHDTRDLLARFELFLETSLRDLEDTVIPKHRYEAIQTSLVKQLEHPAKNFQKMGQLLYLLAFDYDGEFNWINRRKEAIQSLSYEDFLDYAHKFLGKENLKRLALFINGPLPSNDHLSYEEISNPDKIKDQICYKGR